jgi:predicted metalloprotease with PDZ domain
MTDIHYNIIPYHPEAHLFTITCTVDKPDPDGQVLSMPAWIPGSYMIRDFAKNIVTIQAACAGDAIAMEKLDKQSWCCAPCDGPLTVVYEVYAWDLSVRTAHLDTTHGYFNGTSVFLCVQGQEHKPCYVNILHPAGEQYRNWQVATAMSLAGASLHGFGQYVAQDYDELIDHPVEMGTFSLASFDVAGVPHDIAITGRHQADMDRLCRDLKQICEHHVGLFGELPEMQRYVFQVMAVGEGYGGLEHRASTSLLCSRNDLPKVGVAEVTDEYRCFLGLCSHEYFHTWNIKRIKPAVFIPYDLDKEAYTHLMWMFEGITSYYDDLALLRTGLIDVESYLELVAQNITRLLRVPGRFKQSVWDSSFYKWTKFYQQDENAPNAIVSYYGKGALIAMGLDLTIRKQTGQASTLDDVMRYLWQRYGKKGIGVPDFGIEQEIAEMLGLKLDDFFNRYLRGTEELPLQQWFAGVGIDYQCFPATSSTDKGGKLPTSQALPRSSLGARFADCVQGVQITHVLDQGTAQQAGLSAGDCILAVDGIRVEIKGLDKRLAEYAPGDKVVAHVFRRDELMVFDLLMQAAPDDTCALQLQGDVPAWLTGVASS